MGNSFNGGGSAWGAWILSGISLVSLSRLACIRKLSPIHPSAVSRSMVFCTSELGTTRWGCTCAGLVGHPSQ